MEVLEAMQRWYVQTVCTGVAITIETHDMTTINTFEDLLPEEPNSRTFNSVDECNFSDIEDFEDILAGFISDGLVVSHENITIITDENGPTRDSSLYYTLSDEGKRRAIVHYLNRLSPLAQEVLMRLKDRPYPSWSTVYGPQSMRDQLGLSTKEIRTGYQEIIDLSLMHYSKDDGYTLNYSGKHARQLMKSMVAAV